VKEEKRKYISAAIAMCLGGVVLALLCLFLAAETRTSYASPVEEAAEEPDLVIGVSAAEETVLATEVISYRLVYTNNYGAPLSNVIITSTLSPKQIYTITYGYLSDPPIATSHFTLSGYFEDGYVLGWQLGELAAGAQGWIVVTTTVPPAAAEPQWEDKTRWPLLGMSAVITTSTPGVSTGNSQGLLGDDASVMIVGPVLLLTKEAHPDPVRPGHLLTYTLLVENKERVDAIAANGIVITDEVPAYTEFVSATGTGYLSPTADGGAVIWHPPDPLDRASTMAVSFTVRITPSFPTCPPPDITNNEYRIDTDETVNPVPGKKQKTDADDVLEKIVETPWPPLAPKEVFPGGHVTYTIYVYNPLHDQPLTGLRVTDTLPGDPNLFLFQDMVARGPSLPTPVATYPQVIWDDLSVDAGGVISFSFRAWVPYHIDIGSSSKAYVNALQASSPDVEICEMEDDDPSEVKVTRQIKLNKTVEPGAVLSGEIVTYTITLENLGDTEITDVRVTDTLASGWLVDFHYLDMVFGPNPEVGYRRNPVVWDGLSVLPYGTTKLIFHARAIGRPLVKYGNDVAAGSPWTTIPGITNKAKVLIKSPFSLNKIVQPSSTFVEESVEYEISICNVATGTYTIDAIGDQLPAGFYAYGQTNHLEDFTVREVLGPGDCMYYDFPVDVTWDVCQYFDLPERITQDPPRVGFHVEGDGDLWYVNVAKLAPLTVNPHVRILKEAGHKAVLRETEEIVTYTITLVNDYDLPVRNVVVEDWLPVDSYGTYFVYSDTVPGFPVPDEVHLDPNYLVWRDQTVPALGELVLAFRARVPENIDFGKYKNTVYASTTDLVCIEDIDPTAQVEVVEELIELKKVAKPDEVPPLGTFQYEISLKNKDSVPIGGIVVTETLPSAPTGDIVFEGMVPGDPSPSQIDGQQMVWRNLTVPGGETLKLRFYARAPVLYSLPAENQLEAWCPRSEEITPDDPWDVTAPVVVLPGVLVENTVFPTQTQNGGIVVYTVTVYNPPDLGYTLSDIRITDTLPSGFSFRRMTGDDPLAPSLRDPLVWELPDLKPDKSRELVFEAQVRCDMPAGTYLNTVKGYSPDVLVPGVEGAAPVLVEATGEPCVSLVKTVSPTRTVNGGLVTYTVTLNNASSYDFEDVRITDTLPAGFLYVGMLGGGPEPITTTPQVVWEMDELRRTLSQDFVFQARVGYGMESGTYSNTVEGYSPSIIIPRLEEVAPVTVDAVVEPGVFMTKTVSPTWTVSGRIVVYTISLDNRTDVALENLQIVDTLPVSFTFLSMLEGPNPTVKSPVEWHPDDLEAGGRQELVFQAYVGCDLETGTYSNSVEGASSTGAVPDLAEAAPLEVESSGEPCVLFHKIVSPQQLAPGETVIYSITLKNQSGLALADVRITDSLPISFTYQGMENFGIEPVQTAPLAWAFPMDIQDGESYEMVFRVEVGSDVPDGTYYNAIAGYSSSGLIPGLAQTAPVQVEGGGGGDDMAVFLPLILRSYAPSRAQDQKQEVEGEEDLVGYDGRMPGWGGAGSARLLLYGPVRGQPRPAE
jgi:uncharacterized repeat protein (TIGR01451 family)